MSVILSSYILDSGRIASCGTVHSPGDRQSLGGRMSWCPWYQFLHSIVTSQTLSACRYTPICTNDDKTMNIPSLSSHDPFQLHFIVFASPTLLYSRNEILSSFSYLREQTNRTYCIKRCLNDKFHFYHPITTCS